MKSKELDSYFMAKKDGVSVPKPRLRLTKWWNDILARIETVRKPLWTELAYIVLSVGRSDQAKLERAIRRLLKRVQSGRVPKKHNWQLLVTSQGSKRKYAVIGYPYKTDSRDERNAMIQEMAAMLEEDTPVHGIAIVGVDATMPSYPYDVLVYVPGHASDALPVERLLPKA